MHPTTSCTIANGATRGSTPDSSSALNWPLDAEITKRLSSSVDGVVSSYVEAAVRFAAFQFSIARPALPIIRRASMTTAMDWTLRVLGGACARLPARNDAGRAASCAVSSYSLGLTMPTKLASPMAECWAGSPFR
eukprot:6916086-Heterocapsa_arctica.AAC.1